MAVCQPVCLQLHQQLSLKPPPLPFAFTAEQDRRLKRELPLTFDRRKLFTILSYPAKIFAFFGISIEIKSFVLFNKKILYKFRFFLFS